MQPALGFVEVPGEGGTATGEVTPEEIEYARQDGRCTVDALNALKQEFDKHPIARPVV